jgi:hypothetical protein
LRIGVMASSLVFLRGFSRLGGAVNRGEAEVSTA